MKKYIEIEEEVYNRILAGKYVDGSMRILKNPARIVFRAFNRKPRVRLKDKLLRHLEHGWVKESVLNYKVFHSIPKNLGIARVTNILNREEKIAENTLIDHEIIDNV